MPEDVSKPIIAAARRLSGQLNRMSFPEPVAWIYNPIDYGRAAHEDYLKRYASNRKRFLFLGMNPGPFGMVQTAVPFGEIAVVRDWLGVREVTTPPLHCHPKRPIQGFACPRSEVSGRRLWGLFAERFGSAKDFFKDHFVANYCPLAFLESSGRNLTPDKLPVALRKELHQYCTEHLSTLLVHLKPEAIIGVGRFAFQRACEAGEPMEIPCFEILHPSPASPAANKDWKGKATRQLMDAGIWKA